MAVRDLVVSVRAGALKIARRQHHEVAAPIRAAARRTDDLEVRLLG
jgi:hypothetical protein